MKYKYKQLTRIYFTDKNIYLLMKLVNYEVFYYFEFESIAARLLLIFFFL